MAKVQVILTEDVAGQGRKGQIVTVSDGYAHNLSLIHISEPTRPY